MRGKREEKRKGKREGEGKGEGDGKAEKEEAHVQLQLLHPGNPQFPALLHKGWVTGCVRDHYKGHLWPGRSPERAGVCLDHRETLCG